MKRILFVVLAIVLALFAFAFTVLNEGQVGLNLYIVEVPPVSIAIVTFAALLVGAVLGVMASVGLVVKRQSEIRKLKKRLAVTEQENLNLRNIPIKEGQ